MKHVIFAILVLYLSMACDEKRELIVESRPMPETIDELHQSLGQPIDSMYGIITIRSEHLGSPGFTEEHYFIDRDGQRWFLETEDGLFVGSKLDPVPETTDTDWMISDEELREVLEEAKESLTPSQDSTQTKP